MNVKIIANSPSLWSRVNNKTWNALLGWIPRPLGTVLRELIYPTIFAKMGQAVKIYPQVLFNNASSIFLGSKVTLKRGVELMVEPESQLRIGNLTRFEPNVRIIAIGKNTTIDVAEQVVVDRGVELKALPGCQMEIGKNTYIGSYVCIAAYEKLKIGKNCQIASHSSLYGYNNNFADPNTIIRKQGHTAKGIVIEDDCWLGGGVRVVDGVTIGKGSVIGAGAVVTKDIPPYSIAAGVPARVIKKRK
jgi:acetyltransferase-like isoleucine patch superfamily enzyme